MIEGAGQTEPGAVLTLITPSSTSANALRAGSIVKAEVMDYIGSGMVSLRIVVPPGKNDQQQNLNQRGTQDTIFIKVKSEVALPKGQNVFLEVVKGDKDLQLKFIGVERQALTAAQTAVLPMRLSQMLSRLSGEKVHTADLGEMVNQLKNLPEGIKQSIPEFKALEKFMPNIQGLNAMNLRSSVQGSGVQYESRLQLALVQGLARAQGYEPDEAQVTALMQKLGWSMGGDLVGGAMKSAGGMTDAQITLLISTLSGKGAMASLKAGGGDALAALKQSVNTPEVAATLKNAGFSEPELMVLRSALEGRAEAPASPGPSPGLSDLYGSLNTSGQMALFARVADTLSNQNVVNALKAQGITQAEAALLIKVLGGSVAVPQSLLASTLQLPSGDIRRGLLNRFSEKLSDPKVKKALIEAGLKSEDIDAVMKGLGGKSMAPASVSSSLAKLQADGDLKALLMKLGEHLSTQETVSKLRDAGVDDAGLKESINKLMNNIEYYQLSSKVGDMLYTFLPVSWDKMEDGELIFKKKEQNGKEFFSCDVNLELDPIGKVSFSITRFEGSFFVSAVAADARTTELIKDAKDELSARFAAQGLKLSAITVGRKPDINFGEAQRTGINLKV